MNQLQTREDIARLGTILCVGAHPDDETWMAGGVMAAAVANGQRVIVVTATKGEAGTTDTERWPQDRLGDIRAQELHDCLRILGVAEHAVLECRDGECDTEDEQTMALRLAHFIHRERPDTILTFGPEGLTGHGDHAAVSRWISRAVQLVDGEPRVYHAVHTQDWYERVGKELDEKANVFFNIERPPFADEADLAINFMLPKAIAHTKYLALKAQASQMEQLLAKFEHEELPEALAHECFIAVK